MVIEICDGWQLRPCDKLNWELWQYCEVQKTARSVKAGTVGEMSWHRTGRFYQASTIEAAIDFVADYKIRNEQPDEVISLAGYINQLRALRQAVKIDFAVPSAFTRRR